MKKVLFLLMACCVVVASFGSTKTSVPPKKAYEIFVPINKAGEKISLMELSQIKVKEFEKRSGRKMKFFDKVSFKLGQRELRKSINVDGSINHKKLNKFGKKGGLFDNFHLGGFALGFFLGLIGVLIAYTIDDDLKPERTKWAWIGVGLYLVIVLIVVLALI